MRVGMVILGVVLMFAGLVPIGLSVRERVRGNRVRANLLEPIGLLIEAIGILLVVIFVFFVRGWFWLFQVPYYLATGWVSYLRRVLSAVEPSTEAVVSAVACVVVFAAGAHVFLRWLLSAWAVQWSAKRTLQLLVLIGVLFASGLAVVGLIQQTGWLIRTPQPLVKDARQIS